MQLQKFGGRILRHRVVKWRHMQCPAEYCEVWGSDKRERRVFQGAMKVGGVQKPG